jgi:hypothetical protein
MRSLFARLALCVVLGLAMMPNPARAQGTASAPSASEAHRAAAREAFGRGVAAAREGHWEEARREFARSHELVPSAVTLLNLAGSQINTGRLVEGYENYKRILHAPADAESHRQRVEQVVVELESRIPRVRIVLVQGSRDDALLLDGRYLAQASPQEPLRVDPGRHRVEVRRPGKPAVRRAFDVSEGQELVLDLDEVCALCEAGRASLEQRAKTVLADGPTASLPVSADRAPAQAKPARSQRAHLTPYLAYGVGAAGALLLAVTGPMALSAEGSLARGCGREPRCSASDVSRADRLALSADIGLGIAVGGALVGTIALLGKRRSERRLTLAPSASRQSAGLVTRMWF